MNDSRSTSNSNDINIYDLLDILLKRKFIILGTIIIVMGLATGYVMLKTTVYTVTASFAVGNLGLGRGKSIESYSEVAKALTSKMRKLKIKQVKTPEKGQIGILLTKTTTGANLKKTIQQIDRYMNEVISRHNKIHAEYVMTYETYIISLKDTYLNIQNRLKLLDNKHRAGKNNLDLDEFGIKTSLEMNLLNISAKLFNSENHAELLKERHSYVLGSAKLNPNATTPKRRAILSLAFILGIIVGVVNAFLVEFYFNYMQYRNRAAN